MPYDFIKVYSVIFILFIYLYVSNCMTSTEKRRWREEVRSMFYHAFDNYMENAYPADELMPLSCQGRYRGTLPARGDMDDVLGNFSLTLVDSFDTLLVFGDIDNFEVAVQHIIRDVHFDRDVVVSVFETNIRVLGGLLSGHVLSAMLKDSGKGMLWYEDELLDMAKDIGYRLLPAFNTTTGIPFPKVNLKYGVNPATAKTGHEKDTCTACAGTMLLEFAALSRLSADPIFEAKAHQAMSRLWELRHRSSNLMGTTLNIHNGDWVRKDSGIGAGIDSYYEYLLKAYVLLGEEEYLDRFNLHYDSIMKYMSQGHYMMDVQMHKPNTLSRNFMDALQAFWPGLQVLKGDLKSAVENHESLYRVIQRHSFLPEAFTSDYRVHWAQHPLRPEFIESTYFLYRATRDPHYLEVGKLVIENLNKLARVPCGFASIKDVRRMTKEDNMDSFVLSETFKYLYLLFSDDEDLLINVDDFIFTTEAHFLPLSLSLLNTARNHSDKQDNVAFVPHPDKEWTCPNSLSESESGTAFVQGIRSAMKEPSGEPMCSNPSPSRPRRLRASEFISGNNVHADHLKIMGIKVLPLQDGRVQLLHASNEAASKEDAEEGLLFMQEMIELAKQQNEYNQKDSRVVQILPTDTHHDSRVLLAGPAHFGLQLNEGNTVMAQVVKAEPIKGCTPLENVVTNSIVVVERGSCMFVDKARRVEDAGGLGLLVIDTTEGTSAFNQPLFAMSGDGHTDVKIPALFLFYNEGMQLLQALQESSKLLVYMGPGAIADAEIGEPLKKLLQKDSFKDSLVVTVGQIDSDQTTKCRRFFSSEGLLVFKVIHQPDLNVVEFQFDKTAFKEATRRTMSKLIERIMRLVQDNPHFVTMDIKQQSGYLLSIGKSIDDAIVGNVAKLKEKLIKVFEDDLKMSFADVLKIATVEDNGLGTVDMETLGKLQDHIDILLDSFVDEQVMEVYGNAESLFIEQVDSSDEDDECPAVPDNSAHVPDGALQSSRPAEVVKDSIRILSKSELRSNGITIEDDRMFRPPGWMILQEDEIFVDEVGRMYSNTGRLQLNINLQNDAAATEEGDSEEYIYRWLPGIPQEVQMERPTEAAVQEECNVEKDHVKKSEENLEEEQEENEEDTSSAACQSSEEVSDIKEHQYPTECNSDDQSLAGCEDLLDSHPDIINNMEEDAEEQEAYESRIRKYQLDELLEEVIEDFVKDFADEHTSHLYDDVAECSIEPPPGTQGESESEQHTEEEDDIQDFTHGDTQQLKDDTVQYCTGPNCDTDEKQKLYYEPNNVHIDETSQQQSSDCKENILSSVENIVPHQESHNTIPLTDILADLATHNQESNTADGRSDLAEDEVDRR